MLLRSTLFAASLFCASVAQAAVVTIDFEGFALAANTGAVQFGAYVEDGVTMTHVYTHYDAVNGNSPYNAQTDSGAIGTTGPHHVMIHNGNGGAGVNFAFSSAVDLLSIDVVRTLEQSAGDLELTISTDHGVLAPFEPAAGDTLDFTQLGSMFTNVTSLTFTMNNPNPRCAATNYTACSGIGLDALTFDDEPSAVPLPAGLPMLLAGLGGLGLVRRRARA